MLVGIGTFAVLRIRNAPARRQRASRFYGSHTRAAWLILGMISLVVVTLLLYRAAQVNTGVFPFGESRWAFASWGLAQLLEPLGEDANEVLEEVFLLANIAVILAFLVIVVYSKHLHIALAPINVATKRVPDGLGALLPVTDAKGVPVDFSDPESLDEDQVFGRGKVEDFSWKGMLDFATCTECGRCQSQCPAWNTGKPLSPKLVIMDLRDHLFAKAPYLLAGDGDGAPVAATGIDEGGPEAAQPGAAHGGVPESGFGRLATPGAAQAGRPLVGTAAELGVIDPDVLWSCTTCGACVEQCPVDIEHVDHIVDMRRYQVLVESSFPSEAGVMLRNIENKGNPWGLSERAREEWTEVLDFEVRRVEAGEPIPADVEWLFWVGCAGALEDRAKKVTRAFAELLHTAGVEFAILGAGETCTGDPARRLGNEFLFQMQVQQNVETLNSIGARKIVATCPHCFNTLANEYPAARRRLRGGAPHPAARPARRGGPAHPGAAGRPARHLPRPVLPRPAQQGLHAAPRGAVHRPRPAPAGDAPVQGTRLLLRRRRRPDVDGGEDRQADQRGAHRRGAVPRPGRGLDRLPVLHGHAVRRGDREEAVRRRPGGRRGPRRRADPPPLPRRSLATAGARPRARPGGRLS